MPHRDLGGKKIRFESEICEMPHDLAEKLGKHSRWFIECSHEARAKVRSSDEGVPLTHGRGVCGSGNRSHSHPARVPARCGQARPLDTGPLRLLRTTPVTCGISIPSITGVIRIPLALELKGEMQGEGQVVGPTCGTHQSPAQARLLVPARGTENCKQSSCCCAVVR